MAVGLGETLPRLSTARLEGGGFGSLAMIQFLGFLLSFAHELDHLDLVDGDQNR